jgi:hypothetical protein
LFADKSDVPVNMKITTYKKIRGYLDSVLNENPLGHIPGTFNLEKVMSISGVQLPKKLLF